MSKNEQLQKMSQVSFLEIPECYGLSEDIKVIYVLSGSWKPSSSDWIGLFHMGKENPNEYVTYEYSKTPVTCLDNDSVKLCVTFKECYLPQVGAEALRFCYVTKQGNIRGKSSPFCFATNDKDSARDDDIDSDIVVVEKEFGDLEKMQSELDEVKRENFSLRKRLEDAEEESQNLTELLSSAEEQVQALCDAVRKQEDIQQETDREKAICQKKMSEEIAQLKQMLIESENEKENFAHQFTVVLENAALAEQGVRTRINQVETERDCVKAELTHLQAATATSRFREAELRKAIEAAHDTTRALIQENSERRRHEDDLLSAESEIKKLTKDLHLAEKIKKELEAKNKIFEHMAEQFESATRTETDSSGQNRRQNSEEENMFESSNSVPEVARSEECLKENVDSSTSSLNDRCSNEESLPLKETKRFFPNALDRFVKNILK